MWKIILNPVYLFIRRQCLKRLSSFREYPVKDFCQFLQPGIHLRLFVFPPIYKIKLVLFGLSINPVFRFLYSLYGDFVYVVTEPEEAQEVAEGEAERFVARQVFVQTGRRNGQLVELTDGVNAGDRVVVAGQNRLSNGAPVTLSPAATDAPADDADAAVEAAETDQ